MFVGLHLLSEAAMQHSNKAQGSSDTNQPEESTTNTLNNASTIAKGENKCASQ
jgi:hypothetical protein